jgi:hypothetical protein
MKTLSLALVLAVGCGSGPEVGDDPDAAPVTDVPGNVGALPRWQLEDVQPGSPRVGQTYGLDTFNDKIIVVTLLEGF